MSRRIRLAVYVLLASVALGSAACMSATGPSAGDCGHNNSGTCL